MPFGVSNSFRRGIMKTYARQSGRSVPTSTDAPRKRIRMDDTGVIRVEIDLSAGSPKPPTSSSAPSSPPAKEQQIFSDPVTRASASPPSSPPTHAISLPVKRHKPAFSFLKRKRAVAEAETALILAEVSENSANTRKAPPAKKARLTQMQIDLGGDVHKTCRGCGMNYTSTNAEDTALHKEFHIMNNGGVDMGKGFLKDVAVVGTASEEDVVVVVEGRSPFSARSKVKRVLEAVNRDLGAIEMDDKTLWGNPKTTAARKFNKHKGGRPRKHPIVEEGEVKDERYKAFLYLEGGKCVGLCLAERIRSASKMIGSNRDADSNLKAIGVGRSSSIMAESAQDIALLGISRVWTSKSHRRRGVASALLDCARRNFYYGIEVPKEMVAFSQPTDSGGHLAEGWFGKTPGWHVYAET